MAWGEDNSGQLGDGKSETEHEKPVRVENITNAVAVAAGEAHAVALLSNGKVMAWGNNGYGQLGNGTSGNTSDEPVEVKGLPSNERVVAVAAGGNSSYAVINNGTVMAWGDNGRGQLGDGSTNNSDEAVPVLCTAGATPCSGSDLTEVTAVKAGWLHAIALLKGGGIASWGSNEHGQLGTESYEASERAVAVKNLGGEAEGIGSGPFKSFAIMKTGSVKWWGAAGDSGGRTSPVEVAGVEHAHSVAGGREFGVAAVGLPEFYVNERLASHANINALGSLTIENPVAGKVTCEAFLGSSIANVLSQGISSTEAFTTYDCTTSRTTECPGAFVTADGSPTLHEETNEHGELETVARRGASYLPFPGELTEIEGEPRLVLRVHLTLVEPCKPIEIPFEGTLRPFWVNGAGNGLFPSSLSFEGSGGITGSLTSPSSELSSENGDNVAYVSGQLRVSGNGDNELITAK